MDRACWSGQWVSKVSWSVSKSVREGDGIMEAWEERREGGMGGWMDGGVHGLGFSQFFHFRLFSFTFPFPFSFSFPLALVLDFDSDFVRKASAAYTFLLAGCGGLMELFIV